jgi:polysaccharide export outer membrane protein
MMKSRGVMMLAFLLSLSIPALAGAQDGRVLPPANTQLDAGTIYATREYLTALLQRYEDESNAAGYSEYVRQIARDEADLIRVRLREGDFEVGDVLKLTVTGQTGMTGDFTVGPGRIVLFPELGQTMPLAGLLRSELSDSLRSFLGRYVRNPQVFVQTSIRLQVFGEVGAPGFLDVSTDLRLTDVLQTAGQVSGSADLKKMKIKRQDEVIWESTALQDAIVRGMTVDQLSLRAGDIIEVPAVKTRNIGQIIRDLYFLVPLSLAIFRIF